MKTNKYMYIIFIIIILITSLGLFKIFNKKMVTITFDTNNGNIIEEITIPQNTKLNSLPRANKEGYTFLYWALNNTEFKLDETIKDNITLTAVYKKIDNTIIVSFDTLNGNDISPLIIEKNTKLNDLPEAQKDGYKFLGWLYLNKDFDEEMVIQNNIVLIAKYRKINE